MRELLIMADFSPASVRKLREAAGHDYKVEVLSGDCEPMLRYAAFRTAEVIIGDPIREELEMAPLLKWLQLPSADSGCCAEEYEFPQGVTVTNASGAFGVTIAEHVLAGILTLCRHLPVYRSYQYRTVDHPAGPEKLLWGGQALIYGTGDVGTQTARRLKAFGMTTVGVCRTRRPLTPDFDQVRTLAEAEPLLQEADVVVCCMPETPQTIGYFGKERLLRMKADAILVNVGCGSLVVSDDLAEVLEGGHLFGAVLDVTEPEPLPREHGLRRLRNVVLTPHVAGLSFGAAEETERKITSICCDNLRRYVSGWPLRNQIDPASGFRKR